MTKECERCSTEFEAKRSTARYCSAACRQAAYAGRLIKDPARKCLTCDSPIGHKRADARYCDDWCRSWGNRVGLGVMDMMSRLPDDEMRQLVAELVAEYPDTV